MLPNLLATGRGRLAAFFFLYVTEGIPLGFTATAIGTQMRRQGVPPDQIGVFVATLYIPWAWKWAIGPVVDTVSFGRFGHRRVWIIVTQLLMMATLLYGVTVDFVQQLTFFTSLIMLHNAFGATQDVAIDALACNVLHKDERGLANGLMFAGASVGQAIGGSGVLFLSKYIPFQQTFYFVAACLLAVTVFIALPLREERDESEVAKRASPRSVVLRVRSATTS
ncbi:MAG: MFS transporter [Planctomycetaceae bacterium]